ncbi:MAG: VPLPA-CTERM sorting domain-containing protein [Pseudomonadota bacterium]
MIAIVAVLGGPAQANTYTYKYTGQDLQCNVPGTCWGPDVIGGITITIVIDETLVPGGLRDIEVRVRSKTLTFAGAGGVGLGVQSMVFTTGFGRSFEMFGDNHFLLFTALTDASGNFIVDLNEEGRPQEFPYLSFADSTIVDSSVYGDVVFDQDGGDYSNTTPGTWTLDSVASPVPVPASLPLLLAGLGGLIVLRRRQSSV